MKIIFLLLYGVSLFVSYSWKFDYSIIQQVPWFKSQRSKNQSSFGSGHNSGNKSAGHNGGRALGSGGRTRPGLGSASAMKEIAARPSLHAPQTDRVANLKQAFHSQFKTSFVSSSTQSHLRPSTAAVPNVVSRKRETAETGDSKKKSRWDE